MDDTGATFPSAKVVDTIGARHGAQSEERWPGARRLGVEIMTAAGVAMTENDFTAVLSFITDSPGLCAVELGVLSDPTRHPGFATMAAQIARLLAPRDGELRVWLDDTSRIEVAEGLADLGVPLRLLWLSAGSAGGAAKLAKADTPAVKELIGPEVRPDDFRFVRSKVRGGCPIVEQDALFVAVNGDVHLCQRRLAQGRPITNLTTRGFESESEGRVLAIRDSLRLDQRKDLGGCEGCRLSCGAALSATALRSFWLARDDQAGIASHAIRRHLFGDVLRLEHRVMRLDLACGRSKRPGFIGVDRFALPGVDIVANLEEPLPFADDVVDYVVASHSIEHIHDVTGLFQEIYRVCKDRAIVTIIGPYANTRLNQANPYHVTVLNEHLARFLTNDAAFPPDFELDHFPRIGSWGLGSSDNSDWQADFRQLKCEFFYMPAYRALAESTKAELRRACDDVCDEFIVHLLVVKSPITDQELLDRARSTAWQETPLLTQRRLEEAVEGAPTILSRLAGQPEQLVQLDARTTSLEVGADDLSNRTEALAARAHHLAESQAADSARIAALETMRAAAEAALARLEGSIQEDQDAFASRLDSFHGDLSRELDALRDRQERHLAAFNERLAHDLLAVDQKGEETRSSALALAARLEAFHDNLSRELDAQRDHQERHLAAFNERLTRDLLAVDQKGEEARSEALQLAARLAEALRDIEVQQAQLPALTERVSSLAASQTEDAARIDALQTMRADGDAQVASLEASVQRSHDAFASRLDALGDDLGRDLEAQRDDHERRLLVLNAGLTRELLAVEQKGEDARSEVLALAARLAALRHDVEVQTARQLEAAQLPSLTEDVASLRSAQAAGGARIDTVEALQNALRQELDAQRDDQMRRLVALNAGLTRDLLAVEHKAEIVEANSRRSDQLVRTALRRLVSSAVSAERSAGLPRRGQPSSPVDPHLSTLGRIDPTENIQLGRFWRQGEMEALTIRCWGTHALAVWTHLPSDEALDLFDAQVELAHGVVASGRISAKTAGGEQLLTLPFSIAADSSEYVLRLTALPGVEEAGVKVFESRTAGWFNRRRRFLVV
jgi:SAM-dependent methyltransferase